jgi:hypothetical protein
LKDFSDDLPSKIENMKKYLLPTALGFAGMFLAHFLLFLLHGGLSLNYMPYIIAYPIVYVVLAFLGTRNNPNWWIRMLFVFY